MKKQLLFIMALMFAGASVWAQNTWEVPGDYATIQAAITAATAGDVIEVSGEHVLTTNISLTKRLTIDGLNVGVIKGDNTLPSISGGRYFMHISGAGAQSVIKNLTFVKTDKAGPQNIIGLQANDVTFDNCDFTGAYVLGDPDVSRAFEVAYNTTGILIQNCSFIALRQPAYFNPGSQGQVLNNYIEGTRGWVLIGQPTPLTEIVFNGNSWLNNAVDIYLDPTIHFGAPYDPISTLISNNNGATMLDNRATYPVLNVTKSIAYTGIQLAINAADPNDVIEVAAGTYAEDIVVDKALDIRGPNYGISPNTAIRGDEAIIHPATSSPNGEVIKVQASDVTINGFTIDGDNPSLTSGYLGTNGADIDAAEAVTVYVANLSNINVTNNIIENLLFFGVTVWGSNANNPATTGHLVHDNLMRNLGTYDTNSGMAYWGGGVLIYYQQYTQITDNVMTNVRVGIQTGQFGKLEPAPQSSHTISGNTIEARRRGVFFNEHYGATPFLVSGNSISAIYHPIETMWDGILIAGQWNVSSTFSDNNIDGAGATSASSIGYQVWNVKYVAPAMISGGSIDNVDIGVFLNNYEAYNQNATIGANANLSGIAIAPNTAGVGIRILDSPSSSHPPVPVPVQLTLGTGVSVTGGADGVSIEGQNASLLGTIDLALSGQTSKYIKLFDNANDIDATAVSFDGKLGSAMSNVELFATEDMLDHKIDLATLGFATVKANNNYTTVNSFVSPNTTPLIQRGIDAASAGWTVNVGVGTFEEDVNVNKSLSLIGAGKDFTTILGPIGGSHATIKVSAGDVLIDGFAISRIGNNTTDWNNTGLNSAGIAIQSQGNYAEVKNCHLFGNRTGIDVNNSNDNNIHNNLIDNNRTGLIFRNQTDNTNFTDNFVTNNWTAGILFLDASNGGNVPVQTALNSTFNNNDISGNWYGDIVDRQEGGSLPAPGVNMKNFECNWYGTAAPVVSTDNSTEPGYAALIPVEYGGTAVAPGGQPNILGPASANIDYTPWLLTDDIENADCRGGELAYNATTDEYYATAQDAIDAANTGDEIEVYYNPTENLAIDKVLIIHYIFNEPF